MHRALTHIKTAADDIAKDLAGYATRAAMEELLPNWLNALQDTNGNFTKAAMIGDIDDIITNLTRLKIGLNEGENANLKMRKSLGLDYELPPFESVPHEGWLNRVRAVYPYFETEGIARIAEQEYHLHRGVLPDSPMAENSR